MAKRNKENRRVEHALPPRPQRFSVLPPKEHDPAVVSVLPPRARRFSILPPEKHDPDDYSAIPREKHDPAKFSVLPSKHKRDRAKQRRREVAREQEASPLE